MKIEKDLRVNVVIVTHDAGGGHEEAVLRPTIFGYHDHGIELRLSRASHQANGLPARGTFVRMTLEWDE